MARPLRAGPAPWDPELPGRGGGAGSSRGGAAGPGPGLPRAARRSPQAGAGAEGGAGPAGGVASLPGGGACLVAGDTRAGVPWGVTVQGTPRAQSAVRRASAEGPAGPGEKRAQKPHAFLPSPAASPAAPLPGSPCRAGFFPRSLQTLA